MKVICGRVGCHAQNLFSAFTSFKCSHTAVSSEHTHTPRAVGSHVLLRRPEGQLGVQCHAQGVHLSHCIEGGMYNAVQQLDPIDPLQ